jgi:hypothetical protein
MVNTRTGTRGGIETAHGQYKDWDMRGDRDCTWSIQGLGHEGG